MKNYLILSVFIISLGIGLATCSSITDAKVVGEEDLNESLKISGLIYHNEAGWQEVKEQIADGNAYYVKALKNIIKKADAFLELEANPVVNKSIIPPSGDKHDYLSLAPYWWPNPDTKDSLPWIRKDGEVNPLTRGDNTDRNRLAEMLTALDYLTIAYYYTDNALYAQKAMSLMKIWFVDAKTRVNPNINFGQGVPGKSEGRPFGVIEWNRITRVVTALQILDESNLLDPTLKKAMNNWLSDYTDWLLTSKLGKQEGSTLNNHANWYDYQVIGLLIYLNRLEEAQARAEAVKNRRIEKQIAIDGSQPEELSRTKSLSYSTMNLKAMVLVGALAQKLDIDLLQYKTKEGKSYLKAAKFLMPYVKGEKEWVHEQISTGGWQAVVDERLIPLFSIMSSIYQKPLLPQEINMQEKLSALERLKFPPILYTKN